MKLFVKDHAALIILQMSQFALMWLLLWLDGYHQVWLLLYIVFLGFFLLGCYLLVRYVSRRSFYQRLQKPLESLNDSLEQMDQTSVSESLRQLLKSQYELYQNEVSSIEARKEEHLLFIDRWVHQMKTPLSVIELTAQHLDEPASSNIREETEQLKTGLNAVLYMARLRTIEQDLHIKGVLLRKLIHETTNENKRFFIRNDVYPKVHIEREDITVETDEKWVVFIMTQLLQNAVKYSSGKSKHIELSLYERSGSAIFEVMDFGVGIPETDKKRIFHAFFTGENGRTYRESTGMGLYLVNEAAGYLGHDIELESDVDRGTTMRIVFPPAQNITQM